MSRTRKYSAEFRLKVVTDYLSGKSGGYKQVAEKYGIHLKAVQRWVGLYQLHGVEGLCKTSGTYSGDFKIYVIEYMHTNKLSLTETANRFCIPDHCTVAKWERIYFEEGPKVLRESGEENTWEIRKLLNPR